MHTWDGEVKGSIAIPESFVNCSFLFETFDKEADDEASGVNDVLLTVVIVSDFFLNTILRGDFKDDWLFVDVSLRETCLYFWEAFISPSVSNL